MFARAKFYSTFLKVALLCLVALPLFGTDYHIEKGSKVGFEIGKYAILSVDGEFKEFEGYLELDEDGDITALHIQAVSDTVSTGKAKRDKFAKEKFLHPEEHKFLTLTLVSYAPKGDKSKAKNKGTLVATLALCGVVKRIELQSTLDTSGDTPKLVLAGKFNSKDFNKKMTASTVRLNLNTKWLKL